MSMSYCKNCNVEITDETDHCPLCKYVLEYGEDAEDSYPNARVAVRRFRFLENITFFLSIVIGFILFFIDYMVNENVAWSLIAILAMLYGNVIIRFAILGRSGYVFKSISLVVLAVVILLGVDYLTGYNRWSLNYVLPSGILLIDIGIIVMMICNRRNWQSYMMSQIMMIVLSIIPVVLYVIGVSKVWQLAMAAQTVSVFLFLGTLIIGDQRARDELKRRFHI